MVSVKRFMASGGGKGFSSRCLERCKKIDRKLNCFAYIGESKGQKGPLNGLPVSFKDCICVKGMRSAAGSKILENYVPVFDSTVSSRIKGNGGLIIGKTNQDEFGFGTFSTNSGFGVPKNPWDSSRSCGGSSGGAACLTAAADFPHIAVGESTGGSISCPAAFCGVVGLTPTYGLVSRNGLIDYANSLDKIGPMGKEVYDVALMLNIIAGKDPMDQTSLNTKKVDYTKFDDKKLKIGLPREMFSSIDRAVKQPVMRTLSKLESEGHKIEECSFPESKYALSCYYIIALSEASTNLSKYCGMRYGLQKEPKGNFNEHFSEIRSEGFGRETKRRIILGTYARMSGYRSQYYMKALKVRTMLISAYKKLFKKYDVLATPTMPILSPKFSEIEKLTPLQCYSMDKLTVGPNLAGLPHISVPRGFSKGIPVGLQFIGDHLNEKAILSAAKKVEDIRGEIKYPVI